MKYAYVRVDSARTSLDHVYRGPYKVHKQLRNTVVLLMNGKLEKVSLQRVKPYRGQLDPQVASPVRRGRPPRASGDAVEVPRP